MMPSGSLPVQTSFWLRFTLATILLSLAWNIWPQSDIWSPAAGSCFGLFGLTLVSGFLAKLGFGGVPLETESPPTSKVDQQETDAEAATDTESEPETDPIGVLVDSMLGHGRQALLLRPELSTNMTSQQRQKAQDNLSGAMAAVAGGDVCIAAWDFDDDPVDDGRSTEFSGRMATVDAFWLDRLQVSNLQFQAFVDEDGYENESYWSNCVRKQLSNFVDKTDMPGPRFWQQGKFPASLANHPVIGICWYEAAAFARWQGKRLPSDAEWLIAAAGPLISSDGHSVQRQFPWGQEPKSGAANLWGSEMANGYKVGTVAIDCLPAGATKAGIQQLLGNAWEWMADEIKITCKTEAVVLDHPVKSLRGGAYDSYFGDQATCQLQSGDCPLARKHNIGFRCAVTASDLETNEASSA